MFVAAVMICVNAHCVFQKQPVLHSTFKQCIASAHKRHVDILRVDKSKNLTVSYGRFKQGVRGVSA